MRESFFIAADEKIARLRSAAGQKSYRSAAVSLALWALKAMLRKKCYYGRIEDARPKPAGKNGLRIHVTLGGGIGDAVINAAYLQALYRYCKQRVDICVATAHGRQVVEGIFYNKSWVRYQEADAGDYDIMLNICRYPFIYYCNMPNLHSAPEALQSYIRAVRHFNDGHPDIENPLFTPNSVIFSRICGHKRWNQADIDDLLDMRSVRFILEHDPQYEKVLPDNGLAPKRYITLQRGVQKRTESTRVWPQSHYRRLVALLKKNFPGYTFCQLGRPDTVRVEGVDLDLRGKTNFEELKVLLKFAHIHIDGDCGMVHLRHFLQGGPSLVIWGPTAADFIGYEENINIQSTTCPACCEWVTPYSDKKCLLSGAAPLCMASVTPEQAFARLKDIV